MGIKTFKKALVLAICAVLLVTATVFTTMAYLTSFDSVNNTFTVGNVKITLDEAKVDQYGDADSSASRVKTNSYKLVPGHKYTKDPTIHVDAASEDCWLFVKLENGLANAEATGNATTIAGQMSTNGWTVVDATNNVYAYKDKATASKDYTVFETFLLSDTVDVTAYANASIKVTAYAIQADGFTTAQAAWSGLLGD